MTQKFKRFWSNDNYLYGYIGMYRLMLPNNWRHDLQKLMFLVSKHDDGEIIRHLSIYVGLSEAAETVKLQKGGSTALRLMLKGFRISVALIVDYQVNTGKGRFSKNSSGFLLSRRSNYLKKIEFDNY